MKSSRTLLYAGVAVVLLLFGASSLNDRNAQLAAARSAVVDAKVHAARLDSLLQVEREAHQRDSASLDSLKLRVARVPRRVVAAPVQVVMVDSTSVNALKTALVSRTEELHAVHVVLKTEQARADSLEALVKQSVADFTRHLANDAELNTLQTQGLNELRQKLDAAEKATRRPWYRRAATRVGQATVVAAAFYLGSRL